MQTRGYMLNLSVSDFMIVLKLEPENEQATSEVVKLEKVMLYV